MSVSIDPSGFVRVTTLWSPGCALFRAAMSSSPSIHVDADRLEPRDRVWVVCTPPLGLRHLAAGCAGSSRVGGGRLLQQAAHTQRPLRERRVAVESVLLQPL